MRVAAGLVPAYYRLVNFQRARDDWLWGPLLIARFRHADYCTTTNRGSIMNKPDGEVHAEV